MACEGRLDLPRLVGGAQVGRGKASQRHDRAAAPFGDEGRAQGRAGIAGGGGHEEPVEESAAIQHTVQAAVQGHAPGQAQVPGAMDFFEGLQQAQHRALQGLLQARRQGDVPGLDGFIGLPGGPQPPAPAQGAAGRILQQGGQGEVPLPLPLDLFLEEGQVGLVLRVGGQTHDLVLILDGLEAQEVGPEGVEQAQGAGGRQVEEEAQGRALAEVQAERGGFAVAIHDQHEAALKARQVVGAGRMGQVVVHGLQSREGLAERGQGRAGAVELRADGLLHQGFPAAGGLEVAGQVRLGQVEVVGRG